MSLSDKLSEANTLLADDKYCEAIALYDRLVECDSSNYEALVNRAQAYSKAKNYQMAIADCDSAIRVNANDFKAYLKKGVALFHSGKYEDAKKVFQEGKLYGEEDMFDLWLNKSNEHLSMKASVAKVRPRFDWYQTDSVVVVSLLVKKCLKDQVSVSFTENGFSTVIRRNGEIISAEFDLFHSIVVSKSSFSVNPFKVELQLAKLEFIKWPVLERSNTAVVAPEKLASLVGLGDTANVHKYPSSSHVTKNWDALEKEVVEEEKNEKLDGEAGLQKMFRDLYQNATDETKRAMNKSFMESEGTVLSTNWSDVGKDNVDMKPPDGMEFKKWE